MPEQYRRPVPTPAPAPAGGVPNTGSRPTPAPAGGPAPAPAPTTAPTPGNGGSMFVPDAIEDLGAVAGRAAAWASDRNNWIRVAKVAVGGALIIAGLAQLGAKPAAQAAAAVAPIGKAAKVVGKVAG